MAYSPYDIPVSQRLSGDIQYKSPATQQMESEVLSHSPYQYLTADNQARFQQSAIMVTQG